MNRASVERCLICYVPTDFTSVDIITTIYKEWKLIDVLQLITNLQITNPVSVKICHTCSRKLEDAFQLRVNFKVTHWSFHSNLRIRYPLRVLQERAAKEICNEFLNSRKGLYEHDHVSVSEQSNVNTYNGEQLLDIDVKSENLDNEILEIEEFESLTNFSGRTLRSSNQNVKTNERAASAHFNNNLDKDILEIASSSNLTNFRVQTRTSNQNVKLNKTAEVNDSNYNLDKVTESLITPVDCRAEVKSESSEEIFRHQSLKSSFRGSTPNETGTSGVFIKVEYNTESSIPINCTSTQDVDVDVFMTPVELIPETLNSEEVIVTQKPDVTISKNAKRGRKKGNKTEVKTSIASNRKRAGKQNDKSVDSTEEVNKSGKNTTESNKISKLTSTPEPEPKSQDETVEFSFLGDLNSLMKMEPSPSPPADSKEDCFEILSVSPNREPFGTEIQLSTEEEPYFCRPCGKDFKRKSCLQSHNRQVHKLSPSKPYYFFKDYIFN